MQRNAGGKPVLSVKEGRWAPISEVVREKAEKEFHSVFVDLEKADDRELRERSYGIV